MKGLYDSRGENIAILVGKALYSPMSGLHVGHCLRGEDIFVDNRGKYLGELVGDDLLLSKDDSPHRATTFNKRWTTARIAVWRMTSRAATGLPEGYSDIDPTRL